MTSRGRNRALLCIGGFIFAVCALCLCVSDRHLLEVISDGAGVALIACATALMAWNAKFMTGQTRLFWGLLAAGCGMWGLNQASWAFYEIVLRKPLPDPFPGDVVLFLHIIPITAAVALRPHRQQEHRRIFNTLNFVSLLIWWVFLYAFVVFPDEYVILHIDVYSNNYDLLYFIENLFLMLCLGIVASTATSGWRKIYRGLFLASAIYSLSSEAMNTAIARGQYYSGSLYDLPFLISIGCFVWTAIAGRDLNAAAEPPNAASEKWAAIAQRLAMIAILSLPPMAFWAIFFDRSDPHIRHVRLLVALAAILVLGICIFVRQFVLDRQVMELLETSRRNLENLQRLQNQVVQKEKLASLGQLISGAAHELNNPLAAILGYSELLENDSAMRPEQVSMARKIGMQARRTRELVSGLLSFAQQSPSEKSLLDINGVVQHAVSVETLSLQSRNIHIECRLEQELPQVIGNSNQLFQCCVQIINNAVDALAEIGGGTLTVISYRDGKDVVLEFADSGPGVREPRRVFDPFYTTKAVGKGAGLGLSATYGLIQDHDGQISCHNSEQGGAVFVIRLPIPQPATQALSVMTREAKPATI